MIKNKFCEKEKMNEIRRMFSILLNKNVNTKGNIESVNIRTLISLTAELGKNKKYAEEIKSYFSTALKYILKKEDKKNEQSKCSTYK